MLGWRREGDFPERKIAHVDSEDEDESTSQKKSKKRNKRRSDKAVMTVEGSGTPSDMSPMYL